MAGTAVVPHPSAVPTRQVAAAAVIDTLAGGGTVGDGRPATAARLNLPGGVTEAPNGDLVVVDFGNHRVRRVDRRTGVIHTIAGTGEAGYNGDGIRAVDAQLSRPEFCVYGPTGDLFIADSYNNRIRKVDHATGVISTVAGNGERGAAGDGGAAAAAMLHFPEGLAVDRHGNLFIADTVNRRIRRVDARTGIIETYAGVGAIGVNAEDTPALEARFLRLARIAVDHAGNVYVADSPSHRILVIDAMTRRIRTLAGVGSSGFDGDGGPAAAAALSFPEGVFVAGNGDVYLADVGNQRVRHIEARTGRIQTVAGSGGRGFSGDGGPAREARLWSPGRVWVTRDGDILIADILNARIRRVHGRSGRIHTVVGSGEWGDGGLARDAVLSLPGDVAYQDGKVYIADYGTRRVRCVDLASGVITTVAGGGTRTGENIPAIEADLLLPEGIAVSDDTLFIADNVASRVWAVDLETGRLRTFVGGGSEETDAEGDARAARLRLPSAVSQGPDRLVYISEFGSRRVRVVDPATGRIRTVRGVGASGAALDLAVTSLDATPRGLFMLTHGSPDVMLLDTVRRMLTRLSWSGRVDAPPSGDSQIIDVAVHGSNIYLADTLAHRVVRFQFRRQRVTVVAGTGVQGYAGDGADAAAAALFHPGAVALSDDGRQLFIADSKNHRVRRVRFDPADESW